MEYRSYSRYLRETYSKKGFRIAVDAGFTCPNRDAVSGTGGCFFCGSDGALAPYQNRGYPIDKQIKERANALRRRHGDNIILLLYLQAFSNTYASVEHLKEVYDQALSCESFSEMIIATRPDCIDISNAALLHYYKSDLEVWVELGFQTLNDKTLNRIGRGHDAAASLCAFRILREHGIKVTVHLIIGLPGETPSMINDTIERVAELQPDGVKFHNLFLSPKTPLYEEWRRGAFELMGAEEYIATVGNAISRLPKETVIVRVASDVSDRDVIADGCEKREVLRQLQQRNQG